MSDRAEFEAWARDYMLADITRRSDGEYAVRETSDLWQAWCAARRWRPIETAPKDGAIILGYDPDGDCEHFSFSAVATICHERDRGWCYANTADGVNDDTLHPTHWMPLPEPPND